MLHEGWIFFFDKYMKGGLTSSKDRKLKVNYQTIPHLRFNSIGSHASYSCFQNDHDI